MSSGNDSALFGDFGLYQNNQSQYHQDYRDQQICEPTYKNHPAQPANHFRTQRPQDDPHDLIGNDLFEQYLPMSHPLFSAANAQKQQAVPRRPQLTQHDSNNARLPESDGAVRQQTQYQFQRSEKNVQVPLPPTPCEEIVQYSFGDTQPKAIDGLDSAANRQMATCPRTEINLRSSSTVHQMNSTTEPVTTRDRENKTDAHKLDTASAVALSSYSAEGVQADGDTTPIECQRSSYVSAGGGKVDEETTGSVGKRDEEAMGKEPEKRPVKRGQASTTVEKKNAKSSEDERRDRSESPPPAKKPRVSMKCSKTKATGSMQCHDKKVVMEDENVTVYQDTYTVVYKNASQVMDSLKKILNENIQKAKTDMAKLSNDRLKSFEDKLNAILDAKLSKLSTASTKESPKLQPAPVKYVIVTNKNVCGEFRMTALATSEDLKKRISRLKDNERIQVNFRKDFGIEEFRQMLKEEKIIGKTKNDITYNGSLSDLEETLIGKVENKCDIAYTSGTERSSSPVSSNKKRKQKKNDKKDEVRRSHVEDHTEISEPEVEEEEIVHKKVHRSEEYKHKRDRKDKNRSVERERYTKESDPEEVEDEDDDDDEYEREDVQSEEGREKSPIDKKKRKRDRTPEKRSVESKRKRSKNDSDDEKNNEKVKRDVRPPKEKKKKVVSKKKHHVSDEDE